MNKPSYLLSLFLAMAVILAACGPGQDLTETPVLTEPLGSPEVTEPVESPEVTEPLGSPEVTAPVITPTIQTTQPVTGTEVIPPTGFIDPGRLSNLLDFGVWNQNDEQIGEVEDLLLDLGSAQVDYVIVNTAGYPDTAQKLVPVPWGALMVVSAQAQAAPTSGPQNGFVLSVDQSVFANAPELDLAAIPELGEQAEGWDADIRSYWQDIIGTPGSETPTPSTTEQIGLEGVVLATKLLSVSFQVEGGLVSMSMNDVLLDAESGAVKYVVLSVSTQTMGERLIPIPLKILTWDAANQVFIPNVVDPQAIEQAPSFQAGKYPLTVTPDWDADLRSYWEQYISPGS